MTDRPSTFDSGIKCMPSEKSAVDLPQNLVKSSDEILTELFGSFNSKPPASLESLDRPGPTPSLINKSNKQHHKKNKKHKRLSHKHKRKPKSKKNKRHKRMSSVTRNTCSPKPKEIADNYGSRRTSVNSEETCFENNSRSSCVVEDNFVNLGLSILNQEESSKNSCPEMEVIQQETGPVALDIELLLNSSDGLTQSTSQDCLSINTSVDTNVVHIEMDKNADEGLQTDVTVAVSTKKSPNNALLGLVVKTKTSRPTSSEINLEKVKELSLPQSVTDTANIEVAKSPVMSCVGLGLETQKEQHPSTEAINEMVKQQQSKTGSRDRSRSPVKKLKRSKECSPERIGHKRSSKRLKHRNRSKSQEVDHHHTKNGKGNRKKRSRSRDLDHESKDKKRRSRSAEKSAYSNDRKNNRSCSRDRKTRTGDKKRRSKSCDKRIHHEVNHNKGREGSGYHRDKGKKSRSRDRRKRSISRERSKDRKNTMKRKGRSVSKDSKTRIKSRDRSRSRDRKPSRSVDRDTNRIRKSKSQNRSAEKSIENVIRESNTSRSKSEAGVSHVENPIEQITITETVNLSSVKDSRSRSIDVDIPISDQSISPSIDKVECQGESHTQVSLQIESKDCFNHDLDSDQSKTKDQSNNNDVDKCKIDKKKSRGNYRKSRSKTPNKDSQQRDKKRRSKSTDSHSHHSRPKRKSRSRSHNKDSKKNDKRRQSKSKDGDVRRSDRKSRSKSRSRRKSNRIKKGQNKDQEDHNMKKTRSKSKDAEGRNINRKSRSKSRDKDKSSHRTDKRSRSKSPDRSRRNIRKKRSRSREVHIDKRKLFEIARKNAMSMLKQAAAPFCTENIVTIKAGGKSVEELTDFCKQLSKKEAGASTDSDGDETHHSDSDIERPFHHPFQLKERPTNIVLNIRNLRATSTVMPPKRKSIGRSTSEARKKRALRASETDEQRENSVSVPTKTFQEKTAEQSKQLRLQFPVSSGQNHRKTESEWVPVAPGQPSTSIHTSSNASQPSQPVSQALSQPISTAISTAVPSTVLAEVQTDLQSDSSVFPPAPASPPDIGNIVEKRVNAMRKLTANPNDSHAISQIYQVNQQMSMWLASKQQPGQFTGSTGAKVLTAAQLSTGYQAWAKKVTPLPDMAPEGLGTGVEGEETMHV